LNWLSREYSIRHEIHVDYRIVGNVILQNMRDNFLDFRFNPQTIKNISISLVMQI